MNIELETLSDYFVVTLPEGITAGDPWGITWYPDIDSWCEQTYGTRDMWGEPPVNGWKRMRNKYYFTDDTKRLWFIMRWA
jgi:hypothetical protein